MAFVWGYRIDKPIREAFSDTELLNSQGNVEFGMDAGGELLGEIAEDFPAYLLQYLAIWNGLQVAKGLRV